MRPESPVRDEEEVKRRKAILERKAKGPSKVAMKRARRSKAKKMKAGMKILRRMKYIH